LEQRRTPEEAIMKSLGLILICGGILLLAPASASGQGYLTAFVGGNFGGTSGVSLDQSINDTSKLDFGVRLGILGGGVFGGEFEFGYTPNFYGKGTVFDSSSVRTVMGNLVLGVPAGPVRPYAVIGVGLIRRTVDYAPSQGHTGVTDSRAAYDLGGGVSLFVSRHVGINADFRYFRNFTTGNAVLDLSDDKFNYGRGAIGVAFKF
jgi:opacity protein-like surface antigen